MKDIILYEGNILNISMLFFNSIENALHLLCTNIHFYVHHNVLMVVLSQVRGSLGEGLKELVTGFIFLPPELVRSRTENRNKMFSLVAYWQCSN